MVKRCLKLTPEYEQPDPIHRRGHDAQVEYLLTLAPGQLRSLQPRRVFGNPARRAAGLQLAIVLRPEPWRTAVGGAQRRTERSPVRRRQLDDESKRVVLAVLAHRALDSRRPRQLQADPP